MCEPELYVPLVLLKRHALNLADIFTFKQNAKPHSMTTADDRIENAQYVHMDVVLDRDLSMRMLFFYGLKA